MEEKKQRRKHFENQPATCCCAGPKHNDKSSKNAKALFPSSPHQPSARCLYGKPTATASISVQVAQSSRFNSFQPKIAAAAYRCVVHVCREKDEVVIELVCAASVVE